MKRIIIGGASSHAGKTALAEGLLRRLRPERWAAVKVTVIENEEEIAAHVSEASRLLEFAARGSVVISEEAIIRQPSSDTGRFAAAGAWPVLWAVVRPDQIMVAWNDIEKHLGGVSGVLIESSRLALLLSADLTVCLISLRVPPSRWKADAPALIARADVVVVAGATACDEDAARIIADIRRHRRDRPLIVCDTVEHAITSSDMRERLVALGTPG